MTEEKDLRQQFCQIGRLLHQAGLVDGTSGNLSARLDEDRFLVTASGVHKGLIRPEQMLIVNLAGERIDKANPQNAHLQPTSEFRMHLEAFKKRPDVGGVIHAHPIFAVALTMSGINFADFTVPESIISLGEVATTPYATPSGEENRVAISALIENHNAILLAYHGSLTVGAHIWEAYTRLETLEHTAQIIHRVQQLGGYQALPEHQLEKLRHLSQIYTIHPPLSESV